MPESSAKGIWVKSAGVAIVARLRTGSPG